MGLIGGSIGLRAKTLGWEAIGWDREPAVAREARARDAVSATAGSLAELAAAVDVLVLAGPVDAIVAQLEELTHGADARPALVLDVGSVKEPVARAGRELVTFVPSHPIAGSERSGPGVARSDLFLGRAWAYDGGLHPVAAERAVRFISAMGGRPFAIDSAEHDRLIALTSHLPQIVSVALGARLNAALAEPAALDLCGPGMRSMLRLGASSFSMWGPLLASNAAPLAQEVRALAAILHKAADALELGATSDLGSLFAAAAQSVAALRKSDTAASAASNGIELPGER